jgi:hypothetical protein
MATSAVCITGLRFLHDAHGAKPETGLNVIDLTELSRGAQAILLILCILGSTSVVSVLPLFVRRMIIRRRCAADVSPRTKLELSAMLRLIIIVPMYLIVHIVAVFVAGGLYTQFTTNQLVQSTLQEAHVSPWYASAFISVRTRIASMILIAVCRSQPVPMLASLHFSQVLRGTSGAAFCSSSTRTRSSQALQVRIRSDVVAHLSGQVFRLYFDLGWCVYPVALGSLKTP